MRSYVTYSFNKDSGDEVKVDGGLGGIGITQKVHSRWDVSLEKEVADETVVMQLTPVEARELATNLLNAAQFAEAAEKIHGVTSIRRY